MFFNRFSLNKPLETAQLFVKKEKDKVVQKIRNAAPKEREVLTKILRNVDLNEVNSAFAEFNDKHWEP